ncbi:MAG: hypothetical protein ACK47M_11555 [Caldilinea sp.]
MPLPGAAQGNVICVSPTGDYPTNQKAVDAAANGDEIRIASGTYEENIAILYGRLGDATDCRRRLPDVSEMEQSAAVRHDSLALATFWLLNAGLLLRVVAEPAQMVSMDRLRTADCRVGDATVAG